MHPDGIGIFRDFVFTNSSLNNSGQIVLDTDNSGGGVLIHSDGSNVVQVAFKFTLADGRQGIAIATLVPEPGGLLVSLLATMGLLARNRSLG